MNDKEKIKIALELINEMLEISIAQDETHKQKAIEAGKGEQAVGVSWQVFHLKTLKDLLEK